jgi:hypothetical protein
MKAPVLLLLIAAGTARAEPPTQTMTKTFDAAALTTLSVENDRGDTAVEAEGGATITVVATLREWSDKCELTFTPDGKTLKIVADNDSGFFSRQRCTADLKITAPAALRLDARSGSGDVTVAKLSGPLDIRVGSGDLKMRELATDAVDARVGSGDIEITFAAAPAKGDVSLQAGSGDVIVKLPAGTAVNAELKTGSGEVSNELDNIRSAPFTVHARSGSGDLRVAKL